MAYRRTKLARNILGGLLLLIGPAGLMNNLDRVATGAGDQPKPNETAAPTPFPTIVIPMTPDGQATNVYGSQPLQQLIDEIRRVDGQGTPTAQSATATLVVTSTAALSEGELIRDPATRAARDLTLRYTSTRPPMSEREAMQVVADTGVPWALGGQWEGKEVTVQMVHGLATFGQPADTTGIYTTDGKTPLTGECAGWLGPCGMHVQQCSAGKCTDTGRTLGRLVDRPVWIIDYGNTVMVHSAAVCAAECPGPVPPNDNHTVYVVDVAEKMLLGIHSYHAP